MKHSTITARVDAAAASATQALRTTMLVAASMPALPAASRNWRSGVLCACGELRRWPATTRSSVSARWSDR